MKRRPARVALAVVTVAVLFGLAGCGSGSDDDESSAPSAHDDHSGHAPAVASAGAAAPTRHIGPQGAVGQFVTDCAHSHSAPDDPIVHPGKPGRSHQHDFFGNVSTDAYSTAESLVGKATTCQDQADTAAYWSPRLLVDGQAVIPVNSTAYYRAAPGVESTDVEAFPPGLMMVAGDMTADASNPQDADLAGWTCGASTRNEQSPPICPASAPLRAVVTFPDCWDGTNLDSEDHRSHMANSSDGECPASHPVHVPQLTFAIDYPVSGGGSEVMLASGSPYGIHADFVNAWDQDALRNEVETCLHLDAVCGLSSNRGEEPLFSG